MRKHLPRVWRAGGSLRWFTALAALLAMTLVSSVLAAPITVIDDAGPDDEPGQKDLNQMVVDYQPSNGFDLTVSWNWDDTSVSGNNTGDACSLFDTDGDGFANYSLCVVWENGATYKNTILYSCGDNRADRCDQPIAILSQDLNKDGKLDGNYSSTCSIQKANYDPFTATHKSNQDDPINDTMATCNIKLSDISTQTDPFLLNVCSYPSGPPNADPSDCVIAPNSGFLTIVKDAGTDTTTGFNFTLSPAANDKRTQFAITGSGSVQLIPVDATVNYSLSEASLPAGWTLDGASCVTNGTATGTRSGSTISNIDIQTGKNTVCTFINKHITPTILVDKTANPTSVAETGANVTYTYRVTNTSSVPLTISSLSDDKFGTLAGDADCQVSTVLAAGASCDFTTTQPVSGNAGTTHTNIFTAVATAAWGVTATDDDNAVVTFTNVAPTLEVSKTANPTSLPETGGNVTYTYTVKNTSAEPVTITALNDDKFGLLTGSDSCKLGTLLAAGASCSFTYTTTLSGNAGTSHVNVFTATVTDDDNSSATAHDDATVTFTDVAPTLEVSKTADPTSVPETGGNVTFTYTVKNTSAEPVTITALNDDKFGSLAGGSGCTLGVVLAPGASCSFTYTSSSPLSGEAGTSHVNVFTATVKDDDNTSATANDDATVTFTDVPPAITVEKTANPTVVPETGGSVTFTYKVTNTGTESVTISSLKDDKFGTLTGDNDCQVGSVLAVGASCEFTYTTVLNGDAGTSHVNVFTAVAIDNDGSSATASADASVSFTDVLPDISVTKTADPTSVPETGGSVVFTFVVTNNSDEPVKLVSLSDSVFGTLAGDADCKVDTILPGKGACTFSITETVSGDYPGSHVNTITVTAKDDEGNADTASADATVTFTDVLPDISVTKTADPTSVSETGGSVTFTYVVTNKSTEAATITVLSDDKFGTLAGDADCQVGTLLAAGASCEFTYTTTLSGEASTSHVNTFTATAQDDEGNADTASADATVTFTDVLPDISVTKTADPTSVSETGGSVTFTYVVTNKSTEAATITVLSDDKFGTLAGDADCQVGTLLAAGASCEFTYTTTLSGEASTSHVNTFTATAQDNDGNNVNASDTATVTFEDVLPTITVTKSATPSTVPETGGAVTFAFKVTNTSLEPVTITSLSDSVFGTLLGSTDCQVGTVLQPAASCIFTLTQTVSGDYPNSHVNTFTVVAEDNEHNPVTANDTATVSFSDVLPDVTVTKVASPTTVPETGGDVTFYFKVTNNSTEVATITSLEDDKFGLLTGDADCQVGTVLQPGAFCDFSISKQISGDYPGSHTNTFTAVLADDDGNTASDDDAAVVSFSDVKPEVTVNKSASPTSVPETGANVLFTFTVTNSGAVPATITDLTDSVFGTLTGDADCQVGTLLAPGASCEFSISQWISGDYGTDHYNVFTTTVEDDDGNTDSDQDDETVVLDDVKPAVTVTKTANPTSVPESGANVTYTFTVKNDSTEAATITALSDDTFGLLAGDADCKVGTVLAAGASCDFTLVEFISGDYPGSHVNVFTGTLSDDDSNSASDTDDATVDYSDVLPDVMVTKSADVVSVPETGGEVIFTFEVKNNSTEAATITALSDDIFGTLDGSADCKVGTILAAGASCSFTYTATITGDYPNNHHNVFTATVKDDDGNTDTDDDDANVAFSDVKPSVIVTKTAEPLIVPETGGDVTYTFVVKNTSTEAATIIALSDSKFGVLVGDDDCKAGSVLAAGASCEFTLTRTISGDYPGSHVNVFTATLADDDNNMVSDDDEASVSFSDVLPAVTVTKTVNPTSVPESGANVTYTFTVKNDSTEAATITALSDDKFGTLTGDADCKVGTVLAAGTFCDFTLVKFISGDYPGSHVNVFTGTLSDDDSNSASDTDDASVDFSDVLPAVTVTKTANPTSVPESGANVTYTFIVKNDSTEAATITVLSDDKFGALVGSSTCKVGTILAPGASCTFTLVKFISGDFPGSHVNVFSATLADDDGNSVSDDDDATVTFSDVLPDVVITKTANPTAVPASGGNVTFTFTVWNKSSEPATLTTLTDSKFGTLNGKGSCVVPQSLAASDGTVGGADTYTCTYTVFLKGTLNANGIGYIDHVNVATATATDDDGNSDTASDDATVSFTWRGRTPGYWKNHAKEWPTFSVINYKGVTVQVKTTTLVRDVFNVPATKDFSCIGTKDTLLSALDYKGGSTLCGATQILLRAATAALLNEAYFGSAYPAYNSTADLITAVNAAIASNNRQTIINLATYLDYWNNGIH